MEQVGRRARRSPWECMEGIHRLHRQWQRKRKHSNEMGTGANGASSQSPGSRSAPWESVDVQTSTPKASHPPSPRRIARHIRGHIWLTSDETRIEKFRLDDVLLGFRYRTERALR